MLALDIIRAWKDEEYRLGLTPTEMEAIPVHPAGLVELVDGDLFLIAGSKDAVPDATARILTMGCCAGFTVDPSACGLCTWYTCRFPCGATGYYTC
jgi:mersacidin/lichenicidin family type 2 lantibiotic